MKKMDGLELLAGLSILFWFMHYIIFMDYISKELSLKSQTQLMCVTFEPKLQVQANVDDDDGRDKPRNRLCSSGQEV